MKNIMKQFRIFTFKRGFLTLYQAQIKTFWGWRSFWCGDTGDWHYNVNPNNCKSVEENSIENWRLQAGLHKWQIEIKEKYDEKF